MSGKNIREQFADTMLELGQADERLVVLIGDISHFILQPFAKACPGRFYNVGICEQEIISMAAGLSKMGFHVAAHTIAPFLIERAFEQIKLDFCYQKLGGNLITVGSAFDYANLGCTHHCYGDFALLKTLPNAEICYPASALELDTLFKERYNNKLLTLYRLAGTTHDIDLQASDIKFGKGVFLRGGSNITLVATGPQIDNAKAAADMLLADGIDADVIYIHTIRPLDTDLIRERVKETRRVLVIEEHMQSGGLGDDVLKATYDIAELQFSSLSIPDTFVRDYGLYKDLCMSLGLSATGIRKKVLKDFSF